MTGYIIKQHPGKVYASEIDKSWRATATIDLVLGEMVAQGPAPLGRNTKKHGKPKGYLWQLNLKVNNIQIRLLYRQFGMYIVLLHIHSKASDYANSLGYAKALGRLKEIEGMAKGRGFSGLSSVN